jgi:hypothetical protein
MMKGSCLCGATTYEIDEEHIYVLTNCHCSQCRKASGSSHMAALQIPGENFRWTSGQELVSTYPNSKGRSFCSICGSKTPQSQDWTKHVTFHAGSLDGDVGHVLQYNIFTGSKASWHTVDDNIPTFSERETGFLAFRFRIKVMIYQRLRVLIAKLRNSRG